MRHFASFVAISLYVAAACASTESPKSGAGSAPSAPAAAVTPPPAGSAAEAREAPPAPPPEPPPPPVVAVPPAPVLDGHDFTPTAQALLAVGACGDGILPDGVTAELLGKHCAAVTKAQDDYKGKWVQAARPFFAARVPAGLPKAVVYPFAGGDLSTALTVYPDADEITTMSLEPAGDPRTLAALLASPAPPGKLPGGLVKALDTIASELRFLYRVNFSNTMNMIGAMRGGALPTQLVFGLSALKVHGYEVTALRYFQLDDAGQLRYLTDEDVAKAPDATKGKAEARNRIFANAEVRFRKPGGRVQIYRHIQVNLDNAHLKKDPRVLRHLEAKGPVAGMTKAASYLLSWESFSTMRGYLMKHVVWMASDATGIAPRWGKPAGFEYETYGGFVGPHIGAGNGVAKEWREEFEAQPRRELKFRFGYHDKKVANHLVLMKKKA